MSKWSGLGVILIFCYFITGCTSVDSVRVFDNQQADALIKSWQPQAPAPVKTK